MGIMRLLTAVDWGYDSAATLHVVFLRRPRDVFNPQF